MIMENKMLLKGLRKFPTILVSLLALTAYAAHARQTPVFSISAAEYTALLGAACPQAGGVDYDGILINSDTGDGLRCDSAVWVTITVGPGIAAGDNVTWTGDHIWSSGATITSEVDIDTSGLLTARAVNGVFYVNKIAGIGGTGTTGDPWTGWESAVSNFSQRTWYFPSLATGPGYYEVSTQVVVPNMTTLIGDGPENTIIRAASGFATSTPVVRMAPDGSSGQFASMLRDLQVNCNAVAGSIGVFSELLQEQSGVENIIVKDCVSKGISIVYDAAESTNPQQYTVRDVLILANASAGSGWIGLELSGNGAMIRDVSGVSCAMVGAGKLASGGTCIKIFHARAPITGVHFEDMATGIELGDGSAFSARGTTIRNLNGSGVGTGAVDTLIHITDSTYDEVYSFDGIRGSSVSASANILLDDRSGITIPCGTDCFMAFYSTSAEIGGDLTIHGDIVFTGGGLLLPDSTSYGTCGASNEGAVKRLSEGGDSWPFVIVCEDATGAGDYQWRRYGADSPGYTPIDPINWRWIEADDTPANVAAACVDEDWPLDCCTGAGTGPSCTLQAVPIGVLSDGKLYGRGGDVADAGAKTLYVSDDGGQSWTLVDDLAAVDNSMCVIGTEFPCCSGPGTGTCEPATYRLERIYDGASDGEILVVTWNEIIRSTGWPTPTSWARVLEPTDEIDNSICTALDTPLDCCAATPGTGTCEVPYSIFQVWNSVSTWGDYVMASEYNAGLDPDHWEESRYSYISTDGGLTFNTFMDVGLQSDPSAGGAAARDPGEKVHIHGTAIDPWAIVNGTPRFWVSHHQEGGFPNNAQLIYCDDFNPATCSAGKCDCTWNIVDSEPSVAGMQSTQPTTISAAPYGMVLGTDYEPEGHERILRTADPTMMVPEIITELTWSGTSGFTMSTWRDPRTGDVLDVMKDNGTGKPNYVTMSDGRVGTIVAELLPTSDADATAWWGAFITWASGEDWMVITEDNDGGGGTGDGYYLMPAPKRGQDPTYRNNRGNLWPVVGDAADSSVAVGIGADAQLSWSTVIGYRAKADGTALGSVVIGDEATTSSPDTVVIGSKASYPASLEKSVVIGDAAASTSAKSVVIGADTTTGSQQGNVIVGQGISLGGTTGNSVVIGNDAEIADNGSGVVIGATAELAHGTGWGVVIGINGYSTYRGIAIGQESYAGFDSTSVGYNAGPATTAATQRQVNVGIDTISSSNDTVAIGKSATIGAASHGAIAIGSDAIASATDCVVIGEDSTCTAAAGVALGSDTTANSANEINIGGRFFEATGDTAIVAGGGFRFDIEPDGTAANGGLITMGHADNSITGTLIASTISGGGTSGSANTITATAGSYSTISGGYDNTISGTNGIASTISGGGHNKIQTGTTSHSAIGGGSFNTVDAGEYVTISGGTLNSSADTHTTIGGGYDNDIAAGAARSTVAGGYNNDIAAAGTDSTIGGGRDNDTSGTYSTIPGGRLNSATAENSIATGRQAEARSYGGSCHASGAFSVAGDAQTCTYVLRRTTTDATPTYATLNGVAASERITLNNDSTVFVEAHVVARVTGSDTNAAYTCRYAATSNAAGTPSVLGLVEKTTYYEDVASWDIDCGVNSGGTDKINIGVTGQAGTTIQWVASVKVTEVKG